MIIRALTSALATIALVAPALVAAQFIDTSAYGTSLSIMLSPNYPRPGQSVRLSARAVGIDLQNSSMVWLVDGSVVASGTGASTATTLAGKAGDHATVELDVTGDDGITHTAQAIIAPTTVDLIVNSDSYTPPFYLGRSLPSAGTSIIAQAVTNFVLPNGKSLSDSSITFTWKQDGQVLGDLSGRGRSTAVIPIAHLYGGGTISVEAVSSDGTFGGAATVSLPVLSPILDLYEDHPLYGVLFNTSLPLTARSHETEVTFFATPYFMHASGVRDPRLLWEWSVNRTPIATATQRPNELTLNAASSTGLATIHLTLTNSANYFLDPSKEWSVQLTSDPNRTNPFNVFK